MEDHYKMDKHPIPCVQYTKTATDWTVSYANASALAMFGVNHHSKIAVTEFLFHETHSIDITLPSSIQLPDKRRLIVNAQRHSQETISIWLTDITDYTLPLELIATEAELLQERLNTSNKELEDFAYTASHDLQAPLRKIQSFARLLTDRHSANLGSQGLDYLNRITDSARHMESLVNDLLSFSRITRHDRNVFQRVSVLDILNNVISETNASQFAQIEITSQLDNPDIDVAPMQLFRLLQNIIENAIKFVRSDVEPRIQIELSEQLGRELSDMGVSADDKAYQVIRIVDNGVGFSDENAERIFRIFQRLHGKSEYPGTGIGLAICKKIVDNHKGAIKAQGVPMKGATFIIVLPVNQD